MKLPSIPYHFIRNYTPGKSTSIRQYHISRQEQSSCKMLRVPAISYLSMQVAYLPITDERIGSCHPDRVVDAAYVTSFVTAHKIILKDTPEAYDMLKEENIVN